MFPETKGKVQGLDDSQMQVFLQAVKEGPLAYKRQLEANELKLLQTAPENPQLAVKVCDKASTSVEAYRNSVTAIQESIKKVDDAVKTVKVTVRKASNETLQASRVKVVRTRDKIKQEQAKVAAKKQTAEKDVRLSQQVSEQQGVSAETKAKVAEVYTAYTDTVKKDEVVSSAMSSLINDLLGIIADLDAEQAERQAQRERQKTVNNKREAKSGNSFEAPPDQKANATQSNKQGKGVSQAAEFMNSKQDNEPNTVPYSDVDGAVEQRSLDFTVDDKLVECLMGNKTYDRYAIMMRLTDKLLQNVSDNLKAINEELIAIKWDSQGHIYFNNQSFDFKLQDKDSSLRKLQTFMEMDLYTSFVNNEWSKLFIMGHGTIKQYCTSVSILDFATAEQYNEFMTVHVKTGILELKTQNVPKMCKKLKALGMKSISSIRLNGTDVKHSEEAYEEIAQLDEQIANATTQEQYSSLFTQRAQKAMNVPNLDMVNKVNKAQQAMCTDVQLPNFSGVKTLISTLWQKPIFRIPIKVFGYGRGIPFAFSLISMAHPFTLLCGLFGVGVLGALEFKKAKQTIATGGAPTQ